MINILIIDDNLDYATNLLNLIKSRSNDINVCGIAKNGKIALDLINNSKTRIDVILLDLKLPYYDGEYVLNKIIDKDKYEDSIVIISGEINLINKLHRNKMINAIISKSMGLDYLVQRINEIFCYKEKIKQSKIYKEKIIDELRLLNYDMTFKGTKYLIETIEFIIINDIIENYNLEKDVYKYISLKYNATVHNIKCNIIRSNTNMYYSCEIKKLKKYFNMDGDIRPKTKTIIDTVISNVTRRKYTLNNT